MKINDLIPQVSIKIEFDLSKNKFLPTCFGCYVLTNFTGEILYIGQSNNLKARMKQHLENEKKTSLTVDGKVFFFYYKAVELETELNKLERGWLNHYELIEGKIPILNSIHAPI